jgi:hypothetical protein
MDKLNGMFDLGFSGILDDSNRKTMPSYIEKLAEENIDYEPNEIKVDVIPFDNNLGLTRANELTSKASRNVNKDNRFTVEKNIREAEDKKLKEIDKFAENMLIKDFKFDDIQKNLLSKYSKEIINKYFESKIKLILNKFSFLGFEDIIEKEANVIDQSKKENKIKRSFVIDVLKKFSKLEYVSQDIIKQYKDLLNNQRPMKVALNFLFSLNNIKKAYYKNKDDNNKIIFKRDIDNKNINQSNKKDNEKRNSNIKNSNIYVTMLNEFKQLLYSKINKSEISKKLSKNYGIEKFEKFSTIYTNDIDKISKFYERQNFHTDFASLTQEGYELVPKNKPIEIDSNSMLNYAFNLMTSGDKIEDVKEKLNKKFGKEASKIFLSSYEQKINKNFGQLGYLFIDSNIYKDCDEMQDEFSKMQHIGSKLVFSLKANLKCKSCILNKKGECQKVNLLISNNPISRSARAAKNIINKASSFLPKSYIDEFSKNINSEESNKELISNFTIGMQAAYDEEMKNIGKRASKDRTETVDVQEKFILADSFNVDIFKQSSISKVIEDVIGEINV